MNRNCEWTTIQMKIYLLSLGAGLLVGVVYSLLQVRSPAPPLVALVGLLGILVGEQLIPVGKHMLNGSASPPPATRKDREPSVRQLPGRQPAPTPRPEHRPGLSLRAPARFQEKPP